MPISCKGGKTKKYFNPTKGKKPKRKREWRVKDLYRILGALGKRRRKRCKGGGDGRSNGRKGRGV